MISAAGSRRPQQDSNLRTRLRRPVLYPLSYGGLMTPKGYQSGRIGWDRPVSLRIALPNTVASPA